MRNINVILWGIGSMGAGIGRDLAQNKKGISIVGAIDTDPNKIGKDLGDVLATGAPMGVVVSDDPDRVLSQPADVVFLSTSSFTREVLPSLKKIIASGKNVITTAEEMAEPTAAHQGETFYITEALACLEGYERGPAGNTSLTAAFALAQQMPTDAAIVVQETEYTGAGKHPAAQLSFAQDVNGIDILFGDPDEEVPGKNIILPDDPSRIKARPYNLDKCRASYIKHCVGTYAMQSASAEDIAFIMQDIRAARGYVTAELERHGVRVE